MLRSCSFFYGITSSDMSTRQCSSGEDSMEVFEMRGSMEVLLYLCLSAGGSVEAFLCNYRVLSGGGSMVALYYPSSSQSG